MTTCESPRCGVGGEECVVCGEYFPVPDQVAALVKAAEGVLRVMGCLYPEEHVARDALRAALAGVKGGE